MRSLIIGVVILVAVPAYSAGQQRDRSERPSTGRTAEPREKAGQSASAKERISSPRTVRGRWRDEHPQPATLPSHWLTSPNLLRTPASIAWPNYRPPVRRPRSRANLVFVPYAVPVVVEREVVVERTVVAERESDPVVLEPQPLPRLVLDVHPPTAQVFADGYYIGIPEDFRSENGGAAIEPGPHRIDILERDYEPVSFDVDLTRGQSATYRHRLTPIARAPQRASDAAVKAAAEPKRPATFYLIPGCYMGNVPPAEANLPATCDLARALSFQY